MAERQVIDVTEFIDERTTNFFNITTIALCFLVMVADGYDLLATGFVGVGLVQTLHLSPAELGPFFSASAVGVLFGAPVFAYIGDRFGRRQGILWACFILGSAMLACAYAHTLTELILLRFLCGCGLGGVPPNAIALIAEYAPKRVRATHIVIMHLGISIGGMTPAWLTAAVAPAWQTYFLIGGIGALAMVPILVAFLPESIKFLIVRQKDPVRVRKILVSLKPNFDPVRIEGSEFIIRESVRHSAGGNQVKRLFEDGLGPLTLLLWLLFGICFTMHSFLHSWLPLLFHNRGLSPAAMGTTIAMYDVGGWFGALIIGRMMDKKGFAILSVFFVLACFAVAAIGIPGLSPLEVGAAVFASGIFIIGNYLGIVAMVGIIYPTACRATGAGWVNAIGRFGSIAGPMIGAWLISMKLPMPQLFLTPSILLLSGAAGAYVLMRLWQRRLRGDHSVEVSRPALAK